MPLPVLLSAMVRLCDAEADASPSDADHLITLAGLVERRCDALVGDDPATQDALWDAWTGVS